MAIYTKAKLSESVDGTPIKISATSSPGTTIHTAVAGINDFDEIWLWAFNSSSAVVALTIQFGGVTAPDQNIIISLAPKSGLIPIIPGLVLQNEAIIKAFASSANVITLSGFVNKVTS